MRDIFATGHRKPGGAMHIDMIALSEAVCMPVPHVRVCAWCDRMLVGEGDTSDEPVPDDAPTTHGICDDCFGGLRDEWSCRCGCEDRAGHWCPTCGEEPRRLEDPTNE